MAQEPVALLLDDTRLTVEELAACCTVSRDWVIERVHAGVLPAEPAVDPGAWSFSGDELLRALERDFDAAPALAGLVADLLDEVERLRTRLRRAGLSPD